MVFRRRNAWLLAITGPFLAHCAPDFDALSAGYTAGQGSALPDGGSSAGVDAGGGTSNVGGIATGGVSGQSSASGSSGSPGTSGSGGTPVGGGTASGGTTPGAAGTEGGAAELAGAGGAGGAGPEPACVTPHTGQVGYDDFDSGLAAPIFPFLIASGTTDTTKGATCTVEFDPKNGNTCPGSFHVTAAFKAYASGTQADESAFGGFDFSPADWSLAKAMHVMVKVSPVSAPIKAVQLYLQSGDNYAYDSIFEQFKFQSGIWYEIVFPLPGSKLDATKIRRMGVQLTLDRAGTANIPATPPTVELWLDDVWLEAR